MRSLIFAALLLAGLFRASVPPCATVALTLGSDPIAAGQTQTIDSFVTNCDTDKAKFRVTVTVTDSVGGINIVRNTQHQVNGGDSLTLNDSYAIPATGPTGTWRAMTIVFLVAGGSTTEIARDTKEFQVN